MKPYKDPIVEEVRAARALLLAEAGGTLKGLMRMLQKSQKQRGARVVSLPPKRVAPGRRKAG